MSHNEEAPDNRNDGNTRRDIATVRGRAPWRAPESSDPVRYSSDRDGSSGTDCEDSSRRRSGIFRNNRGLMITLIDVLFVTVLFIVYLVVMRPLSDSVSIPPYRVSISSETVSEGLRVRGVVTHRSSVFFPGDQDQVQQPIVTFTVLDQSIADLAPAPSRSRTLDVIVPAESVARREQLVVTVEIGENTGTYELRLE